MLWNQCLISTVGLLACIDWIPWHSHIGMLSLLLLLPPLLLLLASAGW